MKQHLVEKLAHWKNEIEMANLSYDHTTEVMTLVKSYCRLLSDIQNGVDRMCPEENEDPAEVLKELREAYSSSANDNYNRIRLISEIKELTSNIGMLNYTLTEVLKGHIE